MKWIIRTELEAREQNEREWILVSKSVQEDKSATHLG